MYVTVINRDVYTIRVHASAQPPFYLVDSAVSIVQDIFEDFFTVVAGTLPMAAIFLALVCAFLLGLAPLSSCENPEDMDAVSQ